MDKVRAISVLEALASGCSPLTGEAVADESVLNERDVIRALQIAIDELKAHHPQQRLDVNIEDADIKNAIQLFKNHDKNPGTNNLTGFFLGTRKFKDAEILTSVLYGKYRDVYTKGQLLDYFNEYLIANNYIPKSASGKNLYAEIDFFRKERFNNLNEKAIQQLKEKVSELGILKTENLPEYVLNARKIYPRAYEHWSEKELELLSKALKFTNDLDLLSACFQRGKGSIESCGVKLIYDAQQAEQGVQNS